MKKKLLLTASSYEHISNFHIPYLKQFQEQGWETHVAGDYMPTEFEGADRSIQTRFRKDMHIEDNLRTALMLRRLIHSEHYDLIITHTTLGAFFTRIAVFFRLQRPRLIYMCHGYLFSEDMPWHKNLVLKMAEWVTKPVTDLLLTMNQYDYKYACSHHLSKRIFNIPGIGVNFQEFDKAKDLDRKELRKEFGFSDADVVLIYAAEFSGRKSQAILIRAMEYLPEETVLVLPGTGKLYDSCKGLASQINRRIQFPGYVEDVGPWYRMADIAVTSSRTEGLPFNVMEAMYMSLPVVASAVKGHVDLVREGETGLLFPYGDSRRCAEQIQRLIKDPNLRDKLTSGAGKSIQQYSLQQVMPKIMELYLSLGKTELSGDLTDEKRNCEIRF